MWELTCVMWEPTLWAMGVAHALDLVMFGPCKPSPTGWAPKKQNLLQGRTRAQNARADALVV